jgi:hypothetical protein
MKLNRLTRLAHIRGRHSRNRRWASSRRALIVMLLGLMLAGGLVAPSAHAAAPAVSNSVNLRPCVNTGHGVCAPVGHTGSSGLYKMRCWRDGSWATGAYSSNRWFLIALNDGQEGFVHSSYVRNQAPVPNCNTLPYVRAADWALTQIGRTYAESNVAGMYAASDWAPGPYGEWSGDCAKFTQSAFRLAGVGYETGNAIVQYQKYRNRGLIYQGLPRFGDPVFYNTALPYGHTAIYIGGNSVVTTRGYDHAGLTVARVPLNSFANYLGWALV